MVWDTKQKKCLARHSGVLPDPELTEYAFALAKADRYQEAIDVLDLLDNPNTPRALNYRGYATRKLGRTEEGIGYYLKSVALDPNYPQVREYLGEAYIVEGKYDLAKDQLAAIEKLCGSGCAVLPGSGRSAGAGARLVVWPLGAARRKNERQVARPQHERMPPNARQTGSSLSPRFAAGRFAHGAAGARSRGKKGTSGAW